MKPLSPEQSMISQITGIAHKAGQYLIDLRKEGGASGAEILLRRTIAFVTANARNWDVAAVALAITEAKGIAECLDGSSISWYQVKMHPLLFSVGLETATYVRKVSSR